MSDITNSLAAIAALEKFGVDTVQTVFAILAAPASIPAYFKIAACVGDLLKEVKEVIAAIPELKHLNKGDASTLASAFYSAIVAIVGAAI